MANSLDYKKAGVNIDAANELVERIKTITKKTAQPWSIGGIGGFGSMLDVNKIGMDDPIIVSSTDGVGTKLLLAIQANMYGYIGYDLVAMCANDLVVEGAKPLQFLDYYANGKLDVDKASIIMESIANACLEAGCHLVGGETAEMPGMYNEDECDLAGFVIGAIDRKNLDHRQHINEGDVVIGLASNGIHSNGYSLVRAVLQAQHIDIKHNNIIIEGTSLNELLLAPTKIYCQLILHLYHHHFIKRAAHITGGGLTENVPRILPPIYDAVINPALLPSVPIFAWLQEQGNITLQDMLKTFNMGVGMAVICAPNQQDTVMDYVQSIGDIAYVIGRIEQGQGVVRYSE